MPATHVTKARAAEWADPTPDEVEELIRASITHGWRQALEDIEPAHPFFAKRMRSIGLGNWHTLLLLERSGSALDVGCGFGSLALGLGDYYRLAVGMDALSERVRYGSIRASQDGRTTNAFAQGTGLDLPFDSDSFDLVTLNGVLEWAGFHAAGDPAMLQRAMLAETRRVLRPQGTLAVAIENRYAMETLVGMHDTHTGERLLPALPRWLANLVMRIKRHKPFRTYLYSRNGYRRLMRASGFGRAVILDLVSSYNDYDFVVDADDVATYKLLWKRGLVHTFYRRAGTARRFTARFTPGLLGQTAYAYLVVAGTSPTTILDAIHPFWVEAAKHGVTPGRYRFACNGSATGCMAILTHDGATVSKLIAFGVGKAIDEAEVQAFLPHRSGPVTAELQSGQSWTFDGVMVSAYDVLQAR